MAPPILMTGWLLYLYGYDPADTWMTITGFMMISLVLFGVRERTYLAGALLTGLACMLVLALLPRFMTLPERYPVGPELSFMIEWFFSPVIFCFMAIVARMIYRNSVLAEARADQLLRNVLPESIADRLKEGEQYIAERYSGVSIIFVDIVGFTELSSKLRPSELVTILDSIFRQFDLICERYGAEKIKTIGDGYMAATGVPEADSDHAANAARTALAFCESMENSEERLGVNLTIRVGVHTGTVVAGVIGEKKFIYDLWGDTVNVASRMESHGEVGRVHVSKELRDELGSGFSFEDRGEIEVKGKGPMQTFFLLEENARP
ncbi:MAG: adenylate/guanylate cyclase domain-containing protein [Opitutales bacterium]